VTGGAGGRAGGGGACAAGGANDALYTCAVQAEGGIRAWSVTGVQTCALPISHFADARNSHGVVGNALGVLQKAKGAFGSGQVARSEERRVGKESRSCERADQ